MNFQQSKEQQFGMNQAAQTASPPSEIEDVVSAFDSNLNGLDNALHLILNRLEPVMRPSVPTAQSNAVNQAPHVSRCTVSILIEDRARQLRAMTDRIEEAVSRLAV